MLASFWAVKPKLYGTWSLGISSNLCPRSNYTISHPISREKKNPSVLSFSFPSSPKLFFAHPVGRPTPHLHRPLQALPVSSAQHFKITDFKPRLQSTCPFRSEENRTSITGLPTGPEHIFSQLWPKPHKACDTRVLVMGGGGGPQPGSHSSKREGRSEQSHRSNFCKWYR